jgi:hypothetical protein
VRAAHKAAVAATTAAASAAPVPIKLLSLHTQTVVTRYLPRVSPAQSPHHHSTAAAADNCHSDDDSSSDGSGISQWPSEQSLTGFDAALTSYQLEWLRCAAASSIGSSDDGSTAVQHRQNRQQQRQQRSAVQHTAARCDSPPPPPPLEVDVVAAAEHCDAATQASPAASIELMTPVQPAAAAAAVAAPTTAAVPVKAVSVSVAVQCVSPQHKAVQAVQCEARSQQTDPQPVPTVVSTTAQPPPAKAVALALPALQQPTAVAQATVTSSQRSSERVHARVTGPHGMLDAPHGQQHTVWSVQRSAGRAVVMVQLQPREGTSYKQFLSVTDIDGTGMAPIIQTDTAVQQAVSEASSTATVQSAVTARSDRVAEAVRVMQAAGDGVDQWQREQLDPIWQVRLRSHQVLIRVFQCYSDDYVTRYSAHRYWLLRVTCSRTHTTNLQSAHCQDHAFTLPVVYSFTRQLKVSTCIHNLHVHYTCFLHRCRALGLLATS